LSLWDEIQSQAGVLERFLDEQWPEVEEIASWIGGLSFTHVVIAARGSSDNAARYAQYLWGAHNGLNVALAAPSLFTLYDSPPSLDGSLVVGVSQSGQSPDLLAVMERARAVGRPTLAITNDGTSPMATLADRHLDLAAGPELAVAATKSFTSQLMSIAALSVALPGDDSQLSQLQQVPGVISETLAFRIRRFPPAPSPSRTISASTTAPPSTCRRSVRGSSMACRWPTRCCGSGRGGGRW
jgi:glucosamine--fructose-6-phosphate aminotransferase (isomerizing)